MILKFLKGAKLELVKILNSKAVITTLNVDSKKNLFHEISVQSSLLFGLNQKEVLVALFERESLGPTGMGDGIAIPHARVSNVNSVKGMFVKLEKPVLFDSIDGIPVDLIFALFAPLGTSGEHLKALARVSRLLRNESTRHKLRSNQDASVIYSVLTEENEEQAA